MLVSEANLFLNEETTRKQRLSYTVRLSTTTVNHATMVTTLLLNCFTVIYYIHSKYSSLVLFLDLCASSFDCLILETKKAYRDEAVSAITRLDLKIRKLAI